MIPCALRIAAIFIAGMTLSGGVGPAHAADPEAGKIVFAAQCALCHPVQAGRNTLGPSLFGILGRKTGSVPGFRYSPANQNANLLWDEPTLDEYLKAPMTMIPGTSMGFAGVKDDQQRANLVAYIATLK